MADATLNKLVDLIASAESADLRQAAIRVAGGIAPGPHKGLTKALLDALADPSTELRTTAIEAVGKLRIEEALPALENLVRQGGIEVEPAVHAASQLGARGTKLVSKLMDQVPPAVRSRIAGVLARSGSSAVVVTAHVLLDADPKVAEAAARSLALEVPNFTSAQKHSLGRFLIEALTDKKQLASATEAGMIRVLGTLHDERAEDVFWARLAPSLPREVRAAALQALGNQAGKPSDAKVQKLLQCAADRDFQIVASALMILKDVPIGKKNIKPWLQLLDAPDVATRRFAVDRLRGVESSEVARAMLPQLDHADRGLREDVQQALAGYSEGRAALLERLLGASSPDEAWSLARMLAPRFGELSTAQSKRVFEEASKYQDMEDRRAAAFWFFLRELEPRGTRDRLEEKAEALRKKKKYAEAVAYYRLLAQDPACSEDIRFELAATGLKISGHDLGLDARRGDAALGQFSRLLQNNSFDLLGKVNKAKWLDAEDLFYLGFHFVEQTHRARDFGKQVLELVVKKSPKSELGKNAKRKLKSEAAD